TPVTYSIASLPANALSPHACNQSGVLYNPFSITPQYICGSGSTHDQCAVGALSNRHGSLRGPHTNITYTDTNLPLHGALSIISSSLVLLSSDATHTV